MNTNFKNHSLAELIKKGLVTQKKDAYLATLEYFKQLDQNDDVEFDETYLTLYGFARFPLKAFADNKIGVHLRVHPNGNFDLQTQLESLPGVSFTLEDAISLANHFSGNGNFQEFKIKSNYFYVAWDG